MRLRNTTDLPVELVREIIRVVRPPGLGGFDVRVSNYNRTGNFTGRAYWAGSGYHDRACPFVVCRVSRDGFPALLTHLKNQSLRQWAASRVEALVFLMAHELRHLWQAKHKRGRAWGSRGRFSEIDCDAYAMNRLRAWRKLASRSGPAEISEKPLTWEGPGA